MLFSDKVIETKGFGFVFNHLELILFFLLDLKCWVFCEWKCQLMMSVMEFYHIFF